jgi:hypothetical protein
MYDMDQEFIIILKSIDNTLRIFIFFFISGCVSDDTFKKDDPFGLTMIKLLYVVVIHLIMIYYIFWR